MSKQKQRPSFLAVEEYFEAADDQFLPLLKKFQDVKTLGPFADRWAKDSRPWARQQIFKYLDFDWTVIGHQALIKRLFKAAEANHDLELLARFTVYFDRLTEHKIKTKWHWDWQTRASWQEEKLVSQTAKVPLQDVVTQTWAGRTYTYHVWTPPNAKYFSLPTRYYLQRRGWRYFRRMGFQLPDSYCKAIAQVLRQYHDKDVADGPKLLDRRTLLHACFRDERLLQFGPKAVTLRSGQSLSDLKASPRFPQLWKTENGFDVLWSLLTDAKSRLVRTWSKDMILQDHANRCAELPAEDILKLLAHPDEVIKQFAAELLSKSNRVAMLPIEQWLELLNTDDTTALETICNTMQKHVSADRLNLHDCVRLACAEPTSVAQVGFDFLREKSIRSATDLQQITGVANTSCFAIARSSAKWALDILGSKDNYQCDLVMPFFDSLQLPTREEAWNWLVAKDSPGKGDPTLYLRLLENPFADIRNKLVDLMQRQSKLPGSQTESLVPLWMTVLLGIHCGGRQKLKATKQLADAIGKDPAQAESLLPILVAAAQSIRNPESRSALAAITGLAVQSPEMAEKIMQQLPSFEMQQGES